MSLFISVFYLLWAYHMMMCNQSITFILHIKPAFFVCLFVLVSRLVCIFVVLFRS